MNTPFPAGFATRAAQCSIFASTLLAILHEAMPECEQSRPDPGRHTDLVVDVLDVVVHRLRRQEQSLSHLAIREPLDQQAEYLNLAFAQSGRSRRGMDLA